MTDKPRLKNKKSIKIKATARTAREKRLDQALRINMNKRKLQIRERAKFTNIADSD